MNKKPFSGTWICSFSNSEQESEMNYKNGYPNGSFIQMAENGEVLFKGKSEVLTPLNEYLKSKGIKFQYINISKNGEGDLSESEFPYFDVVIYQNSKSNNLSEHIKKFFFLNRKYLPLIEFRFSIERIGRDGESEILYSEWYENRKYFK